MLLRSLAPVFCLEVPLFARHVQARNRDRLNPSLPTGIGRLNVCRHTRDLVPWPLVHYHHSLQTPVKRGPQYTDTFVDTHKPHGSRISLEMTAVQGHHRFDRRMYTQKGCKCVVRSRRVSYLFRIITLGR
jgi:hypothetical protein